MRPRSRFRWIFIVIACALIAAPIAFVATFVLTPVWSWYERTTAIESVGHSGPATWCFVVVYVVLGALLAAVMTRARTTSRSTRSPARH